MFAIVRDNEIKKIIHAHTEFEFENKSYTAKWTSRWTQEEKDAFGIKEIIEGPKEDEQFYWVSPNTIALVDGVPTKTYSCIIKALDDKEQSDENGNPRYEKVYDSTANDGKGAMVDSTKRLITKGLKSNFVDQIKSMCNNFLQPTDWMIVRKHERNIDVPAEVVTYRNAVIAEQDRLETAITACTTVDQLKEVISGQNWPLNNLSI